MSVSEFVLAFVSIVIGIAVADLLNSLHRLLRAGRKVRWDWLTPAFALLMLLAALVFWWWSFSWYGRAQTATIASFLPKLAFLVVSFLMIASALPDEVPEQGIDLREFYLASRLHQWSLLTLSLGLSFAMGMFAFWPTWSHWLWLDVISIVLALSALLSPKVWLHGIALLWITSVSLLFNFTAAIGA